MAGAAAESLVDTQMERDCLVALRGASGEADGVMERHCVRCFLLSERLARHHLTKLDREVALCASLLHDIGLYDAVSEGGVYTDEGGALARSMALAAGWQPARAELCAEACARHHSLRPQWRLGAEVETLRLADRIEVTGGLVRGGLARGEVNAVFGEVARNGFYAGLLHVVGPVLRSRPLTLPAIFRA